MLVMCQDCVFGLCCCKISEVILILIEKAVILLRFCFVYDFFFFCIKHVETFTKMLKLHSLLNLNYTDLHCPLAVS